MTIKRERPKSFITPFGKSVMQRIMLVRHMERKQLAAKLGYSVGYLDAVRYGIRSVGPKLRKRVTELATDVLGTEYTYEEMFTEYYLYKENEDGNNCNCNCK